jgi:hypothetical protein
LQTCVSILHYTITYIAQDDPHKYCDTKWKSLIKKLTKYSPSLGKLLQSLYNLIFGNDHAIVKKTIFETWLPLLKALASFNSICPLIPYSYVLCKFCCIFSNTNVQIDLAKAFAGGLLLDTNVAQHKNFVRDCPTIGNIIIGFLNNWPLPHQALLSAIILKCALPFTTLPSEVEFLPGVTVTQDTEGDATTVTKNGNGVPLEFWQVGHWYPHWPILRTCKKYSDYYTAVPESPDCRLSCVVNF